MPPGKLQVTNGHLGLARPFAPMKLTGKAGRPSGLPVTNPLLILCQGGLQHLLLRPLRGGHTSHTETTTSTATAAYIVGFDSHQNLPTNTPIEANRPKAKGP